MSVWLGAIAVVIGLVMAVMFLPFKSYIERVDPNLWPMRILVYSIMSVLLVIIGLALISQAQS
jgi:hypothetical protein